MSGFTTVFHHTDRNSAKKILKSGKIKQSLNTKTDAMLGKGTYVTKLGPKKTRLQIAKNNYGTSISKTKKRKTDVAIQMQVPQKKISDHTKELGRDVRLHKGDINLSKVRNCKMHVREKKNGNKYKTFKLRK